MGRGRAALDRVVVIVAHPGGFESLCTVLSRLPRRSHDAYVIALGPGVREPQLIAARLERRSKLEVHEVTRRTLLRPGVVYVHPDRALVIDGEDVAPIAVEEMPVDVMLTAAAHHWEEQLTAVVLSGMSTDGRRGAQVVLERGGVVLCESPSHAAFANLPLAVIEAASATAVGSPWELSRWLERGLSVEVTDTGEVDGCTPATLPPALWTVLERLRIRTGVDVYAYKTATICRRVAARARAHGAPTLDAYASAAVGDERELERLQQRMLIGTTDFFRDPEFFADLERSIAPRLIMQPTIDVWCAGCSTGEEAYSIAAVLLDAMRASGSDGRLRVVGTDVREAAIVDARAGRYPIERANAIPERVRREYFVEEGGVVAAGSALRRAVSFRVHDVFDPAPHNELDLISFRNVMLYLRPDAQARALGSLCGALRPAGMLVVGESEGVQWAPRALRPLEGAGSILERV